QAVPWPALITTLGTLLAILALYLAIDRRVSSVNLGIGLFVLSVILVIVGIVGLLMRRRSERAAEEHALTQDSLQIDRRGTAQLDTAIIQKLMQTEANLLELIREKSWPLDEARLQMLKKQVAEFMNKGDLASAFKSQCHALGLLTTKLRQHRNKDEQFKPNW